MNAAEYFFIFVGKVPVKRRKRKDENIGNETKNKPKKDEITDVKLNFTDHMTSGHNRASSLHVDNVCIFSELP